MPDKIHLEIRQNPSQAKAFYEREFNLEQLRFSALKSPYLRNGVSYRNKVANDH